MKKEIILSVLGSIFVIAFLFISAYVFIQITELPSGISDIILISIYMVLILVFSFITIKDLLFIFKNRIVPVQYELPNDMTSLEAGYLYYNRVTNKQVVSLILYEVSKGIFSIIHKDNKIYLKKNYEFPIEEELIIKKAFLNTFNESDEIELKNIKIDCPGTIELSKTSYNSKKRNPLFYMIAFLFFILPYSVYKTRILLNQNVDNKVFIISIILSITCVGVLLLSNYFGKYYNDYKNERYKLVKGYREYLKNVEKEKLELIFKEDDKQFYKILSYAYALGVSNVWHDDLDDLNLIR